MDDRSAMLFRTVQDICAIYEVDIDGRLTQRYFIPEKWDSGPPMIKQLLRENMGLKIFFYSHDVGWWREEVKACCDEVKFKIGPGVAPAGKKIYPDIRQKKAPAAFPVTLSELQHFPKRERTCLIFSAHFSNVINRDIRDAHVLSS